MKNLSVQSSDSLPLQALRLERGWERGGVCVCVGGTGTGGVGTEGTRRLNVDLSCQGHRETELGTTD